MFVRVYNYHMDILDNQYKKSIPCHCSYDEQKGGETVKNTCDYCLDPSSYRPRRIREFRKVQEDERYEIFKDYESDHPINLHFPPETYD